MKHQKNNQIPETGHTYKEYRPVTETCILTYKRIGFTPVQVLNEIKKYLNEEERSKATFASRLDPMAEGYIHILWSGDTEEKNNLMNLDKQYSVEVLLGIKTDTDDVLGLIENVFVIEDFDKNILDKFIGPFEYNYPKYSSPHIKDVLKGNSFEYKKQNGYIYSIDILNMKLINNVDLREKIFEKLDQCNMEGDFRLEKIKRNWNDFFDKNNQINFLVLNLNIKCKSGTYMRVLARELGGLALNIIRGERF